MTIRVFRRQSLRSWIALAMVCALLPLLASAGIGYAVYHQTIVQPFRDVLTRQHDLLLALERIQGDYWTISEALNAYVLTGDAAQRETFDAAAARVEAQFARLEAAAVAQGDGQGDGQIGAARQEWHRVFADAGTVFARPRGGVAAVAELEQVLAVERELPAAARQLEAVLDRMRADSEASHAEALLAFRRMELGALGALLLSLGMMGFGAFIVNRAIVLSADALVAGARRFEAGQHDTPVEVTVPPELAAVAEAFNSMTRTIQQQRAQLADQARRDGLTALLNRREFDAALAARIAALQAGAPGFALLMGDVDHFKRINDLHGHVEGDRVLRRVADLLEAGARAGDRVFRYGGEEFALILGDAGPEGAAVLAERLRRTIAEAFEAEPAGAAEGAAVTISFGMAFCAAPVAPEALIRSADAALYEAKAGGRNRLVVRKG